MVGVGIAWASILSMPYSILSAAIPQNKMGVYMGIFNFFIVLPEITASLAFGWIMNHVLNNNRLAALVVGGFALFWRRFLRNGSRSRTRRNRTIIVPVAA